MPAELRNNSNNLITTRNYICKKGTRLSLIERLGIGLKYYTMRGHHNGYESGPTLESY